MNTLRISLIAGMLSALAPAAVGQTTWYVDNDAPNDPGPGDPLISDPLEDGSAAHPFDAIQEGINAAVNGDTVLIADGTYTGAGNRDLDFGGRLITVRSENGPANCIIDCQGSEADPHRGFYFHNGETADAVLQGLTVMNGFIDALGWVEGGGGILCQGSSPMIIECVLTLNTAGAGGGLGCYSFGNPVIIDCLIMTNLAFDNGGGVVCYPDCNPLILNSQISDNVVDDSPWNLYSGGGIYIEEGGSLLIVNTTIFRNSAPAGGGISYEEGTSQALVNCNIVANTAALDGGGFFCYGQGNGSLLTLESSIVWGNTAENGPQIAIVGNAIHVIVVVYCDIEGGEAAVGAGTPYWGPGNIDADPLFVDAANGLFDLQAGSPCIDAGYNGAVPPDVADLDGDGYTDERTPFDLDGNPRFVQDPFTDDTGLPDPPLYPGIADMGACEYQFCLGDLDGDNAVGLSDLAQLLGGYGTTGGASYYDGDLDGDGDVDLADLAALLGVYGAVC